jgi:hypothetical protein
MEEETWLISYAKKLEYQKGECEFVLYGLLGMFVK